MSESALSYITDILNLPRAEPDAVVDFIVRTDGVMQVVKLPP